MISLSLQNRNPLICPLDDGKPVTCSSGFDSPFRTWLLPLDFDWKPGQPFHHDWQDYRTRKDRSLKTVSDSSHVYPSPGKRTICVKVVDVFGCDSSLTIDVKA